MPNTNVFRVPEMEGLSASDPTIVRFWVDVRDWRTLIVDGPHGSPLTWQLSMPIGSIEFPTEALAVAAGQLWADRTENAK